MRKKSKKAYCQEQILKIRLYLDIWNLYKELGGLVEKDLARKYEIKAKVSQEMNVNQKTVWYALKFWQPFRLMSKIVLLKQKIKELNHVSKQRKIRSSKQNGHCTQSNG